MSKYLANRQFPRLVPQNSIPVSIHEGQHGQAFGLITNVSEGGASFAAGVAYLAGSKILLRICFDRHAEPFVTEARVAWSRKEEGKTGKGFVHGVRFSILEEEQARLLRATLQRPEFQVIFRTHREFPRLVPHDSILVSIQDAQSRQTHGLIVNVSEGGASFSTHVAYAAGSNVLLKIGFDPEMPFATEAQIAWGLEAEGSAGDGSPRFLHGAKFAILEDEKRTELHKILKRPEFKVVFRPQTEVSGDDFPGDPRTELQTKSQPSH